MEQSLNELSAQFDHERTYGARLAQAAAMENAARRAVEQAGDNCCDTVLSPTNLVDPRPILQIVAYDLQLTTSRQAAVGCLMFKRPSGKLRL